jgi:hypothetical protein
MNKTKLLEIVSANPWQTKLSLVKLCAPEITGLDEADHGSFVSKLIAELLEDGKLTKTGKARGTRYAKPGAKPFKKPKITDQERKAVVDAIEGGASLSSEIIEIVGGDIDHLRKVLRELVKSGAIDKTGAARSSRYWPRGKAPKVEAKKSKPGASADKKAPPPKTTRRSIKAAVPLVEKGESKIGDASAARVEMEIPEEPERPKVSPFEALCRVIEGLPRRKIKRRLRQDAVMRDTNVFSLDEIEAKVERAFGVPKYEVSKLIRDHVFGEMGVGSRVPTVTHIQMRYAYKSGNPGWAAYIWRPIDDDDERPPKWQHRSEATYDAWSQADHAAANQIRSGKPLKKGKGK